MTWSTVFLGLIDEYGAASHDVTDNGSVYTSRFTGGRNAFEYVLPILGSARRTAPQDTPETQAKPNVSTKRCNAGSGPATARTLAELQQQLERVPRPLQRTPPTPRACTGELLAGLPRDPEGRPCQQRPRATATTASATTGSTPKAR